MNAGDFELSDPGSWRFRPWLLLIVAVPVALGLAGLERIGRSLSSASLPTGDAEWIWSADEVHRSSPTAFYLLRDFDYPEDTDSSADSPEARLLLAVDEEYRLWVNGFCVGAGVFRSGAALDEIDLSGVLRAGRNRLVLEVRSRSGAGGVLAVLSSGTAEPLLVSDASWSVVRRHQAGLIEGLALPEAAERPKVWRRPVIGRWGRPRRDTSLPPLDARRAVMEGGVGAEDRWAERIERTSVRVRDTGLAGEERVVPVVLIDFGALVHGELELWFNADPARPYALDFSPDEPPTGDVYPGRLEGDIPSPEQPVALLLPGRTWWQDTTIREFRWVRVRGVADVAAARVRQGVPATGRGTTSAHGSDPFPWLFGVEPRRGQ